MICPSCQKYPMPKKWQDLQAAFMECIANKERAEAKVIELNNLLAKYINQRPSDRSLDWAKTILAGRIAHGTGQIEAAEELLRLAGKA